jgi:DNA-binding transcriptional ArsR family regulator
MKQYAGNSVDPFQAIGDPSRRQMLHLLSKQNLTINALAENFDMTRPAVSKHIKILYGAGFISIEDIGRERHCRLNKKGFQDLQQWIGYFDQFWQIKLKKLDDLISKQTKKSKK